MRAWRGLGFGLRIEPTLVRRSFQTFDLPGGKGKFDGVKPDYRYIAGKKSKIKRPLYPIGYEDGRTIVLK